MVWCENRGKHDPICAAKAETRHVNNAAERDRKVVCKVSTDLKAMKNLRIVLAWENA